MSAQAVCARFSMSAQADWQAVVRGLDMSHADGIKRKTSFS
jgi:hypothetical protein